MSKIKKGSEKKVAKGRVAVIAPSNTKKLTDADIERARAALIRAGYSGEIVFSPNYHAEQHRLLTHLTAQQRLDDLHWAFAESGAELILPIVGGAATNELLDHIDWKCIAKSKATFCGFSDIANFCNMIYVKTGKVAYYGNNFRSFADCTGTDYAVKYFRLALSGKTFSVKIPKQYVDDEWKGDGPGSWAPTQHPGMHFVNRRKGEDVSGRIIGGNAFLLTRLLASGYKIPIKDSVLFLETSSAFLRNDFFSMVMALMQRKDFAKAKGVVIGTSQIDSDGKRVSLDYLQAKFDQLLFKPKVPIVVGAPFAHAAPRFTLPIGGTATIIDGKVPGLELSNKPF